MASSKRSTGDLPLFMALSSAESTALRGAADPDLAAREERVRELLQVARAVEESQEARHAVAVDRLELAEKLGRLRRVRGLEPVRARGTAHAHSASSV